MRALVTGATGFLGSTLARRLREEGHEVRALVREGSPLAALGGLGLSLREGDVRDAEAVRRAAEGCDWVFHCAGLHARGSGSPEHLHQVHVDGTAHVLAAARAAGASRVVHTSVHTTLAGRANGRRRPYLASKAAAEALALEAAAGGLPVVVVNPGVCFGPGDRRPSPAGRLVVDFLNRRLNAYVAGRFFAADVEDVALVLLRAAERGEPGRRYLTGGGDVSLTQVFAHLDAMTGGRRSPLRLPGWVARPLGRLGETWARRTGGRSAVTVGDVDLVRSPMGREAAAGGAQGAAELLGRPWTDLRDSLARAVVWYREHGYLETHGL